MRTRLGSSHMTMMMGANFALFGGWVPEQIYYSSFHLIFHYPYITLIYYSSYITPKVLVLKKHGLPKATSGCRFNVRQGTWGLRVQVFK